MRQLERHVRENRLVAHASVRYALRIGQVEDRRQSKWVAIAIECDPFAGEVVVTRRSSRPEALDRVLPRWMGVSCHLLSGIVGGSGGARRRKSALHGLRGELSPTDKPFPRESIY